MPSFNPSTVFQSLQTRTPMKASDHIESAVKRGEIARMRAELDAAPADEKLRLQAAMEIAYEAALPNMTAGRAALGAIERPVEGDDKMPIGRKTDLFMMAMKITAAMDAGPDARVVLKAEEMDVLRERVNRAWPSPSIVAQFAAAIEKDPEPG